MDFSKFKTPDWLVIGGGLLFLIGGFLDWFQVPGELGGQSAGNAFDFILTGLIPWVLIVGAAVITFLLASGRLNTGGPPWGLVILGATAIGALLVLIRLIIGADASELFSGVPSDADPALDRAGGLWICAIAAIVAAAGAFMSFQASGGNMRDLTDMEKMKSAFKNDR
jgi:quinol-cytochrome oxidoreductase complex cytochrome b subunit